MANTLSEQLLQEARPLSRWLCSWKQLPPPYSAAVPFHSTAAPPTCGTFTSLLVLHKPEDSSVRTKQRHNSQAQEAIGFYSLTSIFWASKEGLKFDLITTFTSSLVRPTSRTSGITRKGRMMSLVVRYLQGWKQQQAPRTSWLPCVSNRITFLKRQPPHTGNSSETPAREGVCWFWLG